MFWYSDKRKTFVQIRISRPSRSNSLRLKKTGEDVSPLTGGRGPVHTGVVFGGENWN